MNMQNCNVVTVSSLIICFPEDRPHQLALRPWLLTDDGHIASIDIVLYNYATSDDFA